jgi:hypothetical protein
MDCADRSLSSPLFWFSSAGFGALSAFQFFLNYPSGLFEVPSIGTEE